MKIVLGNILSFNEGYIIHQVNCKGVMGAGIAKTLSDVYPEVKKRYKKACDANKYPDKLYGKVQFVEVSPTLTVVNSFSQYDYGIDEKQTNEKMLIRNIIGVCNKAAREGKKVAIPYGIGCGLGGGNWAHIKSKLEDVNVLVYKLEK